MYEELIQRLRLAKAVLSRNKDLIALLSDAADAIEELMRRCEQFQFMPPPAWIPVTERLPEDKTWVLAHYNSFVAVSGCFNHQWCERRTYVDTSPTHWMPLPEPPKEK